MSIQIKVRTTSETVVDDVEIHHQRQRVRHVSKVVRELNIPTMPTMTTPTFSYVLRCMCCEIYTPHLHCRIFVVYYESR